MRILEADSFALKKDFTGIGLELSCKNIDQGAFTGAVFAQERVDLAWIQDDVRAVQRQCIAEAFTDAASEDNRMDAHLCYRILYSPGKVLATFRGNNVVADILLRINCRTGIDILDLFA